MRPISTTESPALNFDISTGENSKKIRMQNSKIGWLHSLADTPGAKFDITIKDARGGIRFQRKNFGTETEKAGELINFSAALGEEMEVILENVHGAQKVDIFLN